MNDYDRQDRAHIASNQRVKRETGFAVAGWLLMGLGFFIIYCITCLPGCPMNITPPTENVCPRHPNCGICASEAVCVWCGSSDSCVGASSGSCDVETVVSIPERCEGALPPGESYP